MSIPIYGSSIVPTQPRELLLPTDFNTSLLIAIQDHIHKCRPGFKLTTDGHFHNDAYRITSLYTTFTVTVKHNNVNTHQFSLRIRDGHVVFDQHFLGGTYFIAEIELANPNLFDAVVKFINVYLDNVARVVASTELGQYIEALTTCRFKTAATWNARNQ